jgi:Neuraminidase (sialidase)
VHTTFHSAVVVLLLTGSARAADPFLDKTDLFEAGKDGYVVYRIPGIVITAKGTVIAYCEARKGDGNDWDQIDVFARRSTDAGKTWEARQQLVTTDAKIPKNPIAIQQKLGKEGEVTVNNPVMFVDRLKGTVHLLYCVEYMRCFYKKSDDDGKTWSAAREITDTLEKFRKEYDWKAMATGPAHGIQLKNGRLLVPVWLSSGTGGNAHRPSALSVIYSDDHGQTWQRGDIVAINPEPLANPNETCAVQLHDGSVLLNIRHETDQHFRAVSISADGATKWSKPVLDKQLPEPICMASLCRLTEQPAFAKNRILFANPHNPDGRQRRNLTVKLSYDEGKTWPVARALEAGISGYSDLAVGPDGTIYCLYERGGINKNMYKTAALTVARFNLEWLSEGKDALDPK